MLNLVDQNKHQARKHTAILQVVAEFVGRSLEQHSVNFLQDVKNGVKNSYFFKTKTFRLQTSKLFRNRRKTYILDVSCSRFYFGEVQEEFLGQCNGQGISAPRTEGLSVCQWPVPGKNK